MNNVAFVYVKYYFILGRKRIEKTALTLKSELDSATARVEELSKVIIFYYMLFSILSHFFSLTLPFDLAGSSAAQQRGTQN